VHERVGFSARNVHCAQAKVTSGQEAKLTFEKKNREVKPKPF
jgi:hypothetical protein